jgi:multidrug efflux pump subunit AcrB
MNFIAAAIEGARDVAVPVSFSILTNIVAFMPLYFVPGMVGKLFAIFPIVVACVFILSWVEALFVLPAHLAYTREGGATRAGRWLHRRQQAFSRGFGHFIRDRYGPRRFSSPSSVTWPAGGWVSCSCRRRNPIAPW